MIGFAVLISDSPTALTGMQEGMELCFYTVIPSLFPFSVLSILVTSGLIGTSVPVLKPVTRLCRIPAGCESLLAVGILGGYPMGAQITEQAFREGNLTRSEAERMLIICNNAGPAFIFGFLRPLFPSTYWLWALWVIQIICTVFFGILLPGEAEQEKFPLRANPVSLTDAIYLAIRSMIRVSGCIVVFRTFLAFLDKWCFSQLPDIVRILLSGLMELSNGCILLQEIPGSGIRFVTASLFLSFGGICVWLQTDSVSGDIPRRKYLPCKMIHAACSFILSLLFVWLVNR